MKSGLRGRNAGLVRIDGSNAIGDESAKSWRAVAWRNESVHGQFVAWSKNGADRLRASVSALETAEKIRILRAEGKVPAQLEELLNPASFKNGSEFYEKRTAAVFAAVDAVE